MTPLHYTETCDQSMNYVVKNLEKFKIEDNEKTRKYIVDCYSCKKSFMSRIKITKNNQLVDCPNKCQVPKLVIRDTKRTRHVQKLRGPGRPELWIDINGQIMNPEARRKIKANTYKEVIPEKQVLQNAEDDDQCNICLEPLQIGDEIAILSLCNHRNHFKCMSTWLKVRNTCPTCSNPAVI